MTQSSLLAFAVVGQQAEETREQRQALQRAREERKKQALELLGLPWPEPTRKGAGRPTFEHQYRRIASWTPSSWNLRALPYSEIDQIRRLKI